MSALKYWLWLTELPGLTNQTRLALLRHFPTPEDVYYADPEEVLLTEGITREQAKLLEDKDCSGADRILADCQRLDLDLLTIQDAGYPNRLRNIYDPPCLLYVRGRLPAIDDEASIAVVGTRDCTPYGVSCAEKLGYGLAAGGAVVVSGLARGVDSAALRGALRAGGTVTAVLGKEWVIYSSAFLSVQLFLLWSHAKSMLCGEKSFELKKVLTNINMIAILAGAALFLLHIQLPAVIEDSLDMVGSAIGPISMIILGMLMAGMNFKKILGYRRLWLVTALRLVGIPLAAVALLKLSGLAHLVPDGQTILLVSLLATCTPSASTITQMAQIYGKDADYASAINVVTTLLCIFTMPLMVALYQL